MLLGPRGVGKTLLVDLVLQKSRDENKIFRKDGLTVKLHGLLETDDKLALKQIAKQLKLENVEGERVTLQSDFKIISKVKTIQLNEYETAPYFIQLSQNLTWDFLLISVYLPVFA